MRPEEPAPGMWTPEMLQSLDERLREEEQLETATLELRLQYEIVLYETISRIAVLHGKLMRRGKLAQTQALVRVPHQAILRDNVREFILLSRSTIDSISKKLLKLENMM